MADARKPLAIIDKTPTSVAKNLARGSRTARRKTTKDESQSSELVEGLDETPTSLAKNLPTCSRTTTRRKTECSYNNSTDETQSSELRHRYCHVRNKSLSGDQENRNPNVRRAAASSNEDESVQRVYNTRSSVNLSGKSISELSLESKKSISVLAKKKKDPEEEDDSPDSNLNASSSELKLPTFKFKLLIVGESGTGKTTFVKRHLGAVEKRMRIDGDDYMYPIEFLTSHGRICFNAWDTNIRFNIDEYLNGGTCAIIMFDVSSFLSYLKLQFWYRLISRVCGTEIPVVICGNKMDLAERDIQVTRHRVRFHNKRANVDYYELSALSNHNFEPVFLHLARKLFADKTLQIDTDSYTLAKPEVPIRPGSTFLSRARRQFTG